MAGRFRPVANLKDIIEELPEVDDHVDKAARRIATGAAAGPMGRSHPGRYGPVTITRKGKAKRTVAAQGSMAHLDEWGSQNNPPHASMRRAASREGTFRQEGRR